MGHQMLDRPQRILSPLQSANDTCLFRYYDTLIGRFLIFLMIFVTAEVVVTTRQFLSVLELRRSADPPHPVLHHRAPGLGD